MPTRAKVIHTNETSAAAAGAELGRHIRDAHPERPDAVILFASPAFDHALLLHGLVETCRPAALVGASSAGEFTTDAVGTGLACAVALWAPEMKLTAVCARNLSRDRAGAARTLTSAFVGPQNPRFAHQAALVMADALAGHADDLVKQLAALCGGTYRLFGGGAGGDDSFQRRFVFCGTEVIEDGAVALEMLSNKPIGVGVRHGWTPVGSPLHVTEASGTTVTSLNTLPAADIFEEHAKQTGQSLDKKSALPFFLHNILGIATNGGHKLRVPLAIQENGAVACATEIPEGATVHVMGVTTAQAAEAAGASAADAVLQLQGHKPAVALFFDCVATRLRMGKEFGFEVDAVQKHLGDAKLAGCNTIGQIASSEGQFSGFHNCTAVVCVIPE